MDTTVKRALLIPAILAASLLLAACGGGSSVEACSETSDVSLHEGAFANNANLCATPGKVVVLNLEAKNATDAGAGDSGGIGYDVIPYKITNAGTYTFEVEADGENVHELALKDKDGAELLRVKAGAGQKSLNILAGNYDVHVYNGGTKTITYFLRPQKSSAVATVNRMALGAQQIASPVVFDGMVISRDCIGCVLSHIRFDPTGTLVGANFTNAQVSYTNFNEMFLYGANFTNAVLHDNTYVEANLEKAIFVNTKITGFLHFDAATLVGANLSGQNLIEWDLSKMNLFGANLAGANLTNANLSNANLTNANLTNAILTGATLTGANFTNAIMTGVISGN